MNKLVSSLSFGGVIASINLLNSVNVNGDLDPNCGYYVIDQYALPIGGCIVSSDDGVTYSAYLPLCVEDRDDAIEIYYFEGNECGNFSYDGNGSTITTGEYTGITFEVGDDLGDEITAIYCGDNGITDCAAYFQYYTYDEDDEDCSDVISFIETAFVDGYCYNNSGSSLEFDCGNGLINYYFDSDDCSGDETSLAASLVEEGTECELDEWDGERTTLKIPCESIAFIYQPSLLIILSCFIIFALFGI